MPDLEVRTRPAADQPEPLSIGDNLEQAELFRQAKEKLETSLAEIKKTYTPSKAPAHNPPDCERCKTQKQRITKAYYEYYLADTPGRWDANLESYREEQQKNFDQPDGPNLQEVHALFQKTLRQYINRTFLSHRVDDPQEVFDYKTMASDLLEQTKPTNEVLEYIYASHMQFCKSPESATLTRALNIAHTPQERAQAYVAYYCAPSSGDSVQQKNIKQKYARMFEGLMPHDEVIAAWKKEAAASQESNVSKLKSDLVELEMGQRAHLKAKARKEEKKLRGKEREASPRMAACSKDGCPLDVNVGGTEDIIECPICEWVQRVGGRGGRFYYCSEDHARDDFEEHAQREHQCCMTHHCIYAPEAGPNEENGYQIGGLCPNCKDHDTVSFFCSEKCYNQNLETHQEQFHYGRDIPNTSASFVRFTPSLDLEVFS